MSDVAELAPLRAAKMGGVGRLASALWPHELTWKACGAGLLAGCAAMALRAAMQPLLGDAVPFVLAFPAVVLVALRYGAPPAFLTALVCALWTATGLVPPMIPVEYMPMTFGAFVLLAFVMALICAQYRSHEAPANDIPSSAQETALIRWLRAVLWSAALLPLAAFVAAAGWGYQDAFGRARAAGLNAAQVASRHAERTFADVQKVMQRADRLYSSAGAEPARAAELHERLKDLTLALPQEAVLAVIGAQGKMLATSLLYSVVPVDYSDREYFSQIQRQPSLPIYVSEVFTGRLTKRSTMVVSRARFTPDGVFDGVITVALTPDYFQEFYETLAPEQSGNTYLLYRNDGAVITRWPPPTRTLARLPATDALTVQMAAGIASGEMSIKSIFDGERRLLSFVLGKPVEPEVLFAELARALEIKRSPATGDGAAG